MSNLSLDQLNALLPRITDAGFDPQLWNAVLEDIRSTVDLGVASIVAHYFDTSDNDVGSDWSYTTWDNPDELKPYVDHYYRLDPIVPVLDRMPDGRCIRVQEMMTEREWVESEFYQDFQSLCGMVDFASVKMNGAGKSFYEVPIADVGSGGLSQQKVQAINYLAPHIAVAIETNNAIGMRSISTAYGVGGVVEQIQKPSFVLDFHGRVIETNQPALELLREGRVLRDPLGILEVCDATLHAEFKQQVLSLSRHIIHGGQTAIFRKPQEKSTLQLRTEDGDQYRIQLSTLPEAIVRIPLPSGSTWPAIVIIVEKIAKRSGDFIHEFAMRHGLTPAETALMEQLVKGYALREAGDNLRRSYNTVRSQLKSMFLKAHVTSQSQLLNSFYRSTQIDERNHFEPPPKITR